MRSKQYPALRNRRYLRAVSVPMAGLILVLGLVSFYGYTNPPVVEVAVAEVVHDKAWAKAECLKLLPDSKQCEV